MRRVTRRKVLLSGGIALASTCVPTGISSAQEGMEWQMFGHDQQNTNAIPGAGPKRDVSMSSFLETGGTVKSQPVVTGDTVYVCDSDGVLYAVSRGEGTTEWTFDGGSMRGQSPAVVDDTVYYGTIDGTLYALRAENGTERWTYQSGTSIETGITVANGKLSFGGRDGTVYAIDRQDGTELWTTSTESIISSTPAVSDGIAYFGSADNSVYAVEADSGSEVWTYTTDNGINASPAIEGDAVFITSTDGYLYALNKTNGNELWKFGFEGLGGEALAVSNEMVFVTEGVQGRRIHAVNANTGERRWTGETGASVRTAPTVANDVVYIASRDGRVYGIEHESGDLLWKSATESPPTTAPVVVGDTIYVGTEKHGLQAITGEVNLRESTTPSTNHTPTRIPTSTTESPARSDSSIPLLPIAIGTLGLFGGGMYGYRAWKGDNDGSDGGTEGPPPKEEIKSGEESQLDEQESPEETVGYEGPTIFEGQRNEPPVEPTTPKFSIEYGDLTEEELIDADDNNEVSRVVLQLSGTRKPVALKKPVFSNTITSGAIEKLLERAEVWSKLDEHKNIVDVIDHGSKPLPWIATEYIDGNNLAQRGDVEDPLEKLWIAISVIDAIHYAHRKGIRHLRLKPTHILFSNIGTGWNYPKVGGWWPDYEGRKDHILPYTAPEQIDDTVGPVDDITDVYRVGAVLYELITGQPPYYSSSNLENSILNETPALPSDVLTEGYKPVDEILLTALKTDRADRYDSLVYLKDAIDDLYND